jgi:2-haloacid dehalogenase
VSFDPTGLRAISFDCYGSLIDAEAGVRAFVEPVLRRVTSDAARPRVSFEAWLVRWKRIHAAMLRPWRPYRELLQRSFDAAMQHFGLEAFVDDGPGLARSVASWPAFPDTTRALRRLAKRHRLAILANTDSDLLAGSVGQLLAPFSSLLTAEDARAYKPDPAPFQLLIARLGFAAGEILHVAASETEDLAPARALGLRTAKIAADAAASDAADLSVASVAALADLLASSPGP